MVEGTVKELYAKEGEFVKKGQSLAQLRNIQLETQKEQYESSVESAKAALEMAQSDLREQEFNVKTRLLSIQKQEQ